MRLPGDEALVGTVPRVRADLNRAESEESAFHRALNRLLKSGAYTSVLDVHSFPKGHHDAEVVLMPAQDADSQAVADRMVAALEGGGYAAKVAPRGPENWILRKAEKTHTPAVLIEVSEGVDVSRLGDLAAVINAERLAYFAPEGEVWFEEGGPPVSNPLARIRSIIYKCDGSAQVGLCPVNPWGKRFQHEFKVNAPSLDLSNGAIHGKVAYQPSGPILGIGDYQLPISSVEFANSARPAYRIGTLEALVLADGTPWGFGRKVGLFVDSSMSRLFAVAENPAAAGQIGGLPALETPEALVKFVNQRLAAVAFVKTGCAACENVKPHLHALAGMFDYKVAAVDCSVAEMDKAAEELGITLFPTLGIFSHGTRIDLVDDVPGHIERVESSAVPT